jgi:uncharacterized protein (DUF1015 family)
MQIRPFTAVRPPREIADRVAAPPYDVVGVEAARRLADGNPMSFLRVTRPELELPDGTQPYDEAVYRRAGDNYRKFLDKGYLAADTKPCIYVYRIEAGEHRQTGVVAVSSVDDYAANVIRRHEKTRVATETDRTRHITALGAQAGPVFLLHRDDERLAALLARIAEGEPTYDLTTPEGVRHTLWQVADFSPIVDAFAPLDGAYVADGHHRAAAALRVALEREKAGAGAPEDPARWFLTALFPASELKVLSYNRVVADLHGMDEATFIGRVREPFDLTEDAPPAPGGPRQVSMYLGGRWYGLAWPQPAPGDDAVAALDVSVLQDRLLSPVLGIEDPRHDPRIEFLGGIHGPAGLEERVETGRGAVAFSMYPTSLQQLMDVADQGGIMPPKSTWFEPKLRSGLLIYPLD